MKPHGITYASPFHPAAHPDTTDWDAFCAYAWAVSGFANADFSVKLSMREQEDAVLKEAPGAAAAEGNQTYDDAHEGLQTRPDRLFSPLSLL